MDSIDFNIKLRLIEVKTTEALEKIIKNDQKPEALNYELLSTTLIQFLDTLNVIYNFLSGYTGTCIISEDDLILKNKIADSSIHIFTRFNLFNLLQDSRKVLLSDSSHQEKKIAVCDKLLIKLFEFVWMHTIGHERNKVLFKNVISPCISELNYLIDTKYPLESDTSKELANDFCIVISTIWSLCYGIKETQEMSEKLNAHKYLSQAFNMFYSKKEFTLVNQCIVGALWHISMISSSIKEILNSGIVKNLIEFLNGLSDDEKEGGKISCCFLICNICNTNLEDNQDICLCLNSLHSFVTQQNLKEFNNRFVWTTFYPIRILLENRRHPEVREFAALILFSLSKKKESYTRLFQEGCIDEIKKILQDKEIKLSETEKKLYEMVLSTLNVTSEGNIEMAVDLDKFLEACHLSFAFDKLKIKFNSIEQLKSVTFDELKNQFGFEEKQAKMIDATLKCIFNKHFKKIVEKEKDDLCLLCLDKTRKFIFVPCLHFLTCDLCKDIVMAEESRCPFCREEVYNTLNCDSLLSIGE